MESTTILTPLAPADAVFCFPWEPNFPEGPEYEKYQHYCIDAQGEVYQFQIYYN